MKKKIFIIFSLFCVLNIFSDPPEVENAKIYKLISSIRNLKSAVFIRNGTEHNPNDAAKHLKRKYEYYKDEIKNATNFIDELATKSSFTGKFYLIKFKDGKEVKAAKFLKEKLKDIEQNNK